MNANIVITFAYLSMGEAALVFCSPNTRPTLSIRNYIPSIVCFSFIRHIYTQYSIDLHLFFFCLRPSLHTAFTHSLKSRG